jgi:uncharacterized membrane protein
MLGLRKDLPGRKYDLRTLHEKIDHLLLDQWSRMMQIQQVQLDMLEELQKNIHNGNKKARKAEDDQTANINT